MVCLRFEPGAAGWSAQTIPPSHGRRPRSLILILKFGYRVEPRFECRAHFLHCAVSLLNIVKLT